MFIKRFRQDFFKHCGRSVGEDVTVQFCGSGQILGLWWKREKTRWEKEGRKEALNLLHLENRSSSRESPSSLLFYMPRTPRNKEGKMSWIFMSKIIFELGFSNTVKVIRVFSFSLQHSIKNGKKLHKVAETEADQYYSMT